MFARMRRVAGPVTALRGVHAARDAVLRLMLAAAIVWAIATLVACASSPTRDAAATAPVAIAPVPALAASPTLANAVLFRALALIGTPYRRAGRTPESGFDCSGLVGFVYADAAGLTLPRSSAEQRRIAAPDVTRDALAPSDLVFFGARGRISHVGIYVGDGRFVHAPSTGGSVRLDRLDDDYWRRHYAGAKRALALVR